MKNYKVYAYSSAESAEDNAAEFTDRKLAINYANKLVQKFKTEFANNRVFNQDKKLKLQIEKTADKENYQSIQVSEDCSANVADIIFETIEK